MRYRAEIIINEDDDINFAIKNKERLDALIMNKAIKDLENKLNILRGLQHKKW